MAAKNKKVSKKCIKMLKAYYTHDGGAAYDIEPMEEEYAAPKNKQKRKKVKRKE